MGSHLFSPNDAAACWADMLVEDDYFATDLVDCPIIPSDGYIGSSPPYNETDNRIEYAINGFLDQGGGRLRGTDTSGGDFVNYLSTHEPFPGQWITRPADGMLVADGAPLRGPFGQHRSQYYLDPLQTPADKEDGNWHANGKAHHVLFFDGRADAVYSSEDRYPLVSSSIHPYDTGTQSIEQPTPIWRPWKPYFD